MTRYFFRFQQRNRQLHDDQGEDFATLEQAVAHARQVAYELGRNRPEGIADDALIAVMDGDGRELSRVGLYECTRPEAQILYPVD